MAYVGQERSSTGARDYFARHAYRNTELADLLDCLARSSGRDLRAWSRAWLETAGISRLDPVVETGPDGRITRLAVTQDAVDAMTGATVDRPHHVVIGLYERSGDGLARARSIATDVVGPRTEVPEAVGGPAALVLVNDDDLTYAKVRLDPGSLATVRAQLATIPAPLSRALVWSALWNAVRDAELPASDYLDVALGQVGREPAADLLDTVLAQVGVAIEDYLPPAQRAAARSRFVATCRGGLLDAAPGSDTQLTWARHLTRAAATSADGIAAVRGLLDGSTLPAGLPVDPDLRWACWVALAAQDAASPAELDAALAADDTMTGRRAHLLAVASRPGGPRGDLAARHHGRVRHQRPAARSRQRLPPARRPARARLCRALLRLAHRLVGRPHPDHGHDPRPRPVPRRVARRRSATRAAPRGAAGPRLAARPRRRPACVAAHRDRAARRPGTRAARPGRRPVLSPARRPGDRCGSRRTPTGPGTRGRSS